MSVFVDPRDRSNDVEVLSKAEVEELVQAIPQGGPGQTPDDVRQIIRDFFTGNGVRYDPVIDKMVVGTVQTPPPSTGTPYISQMSDIDWINWRPDQGGGGVVESPSFHRISAPSGPGFEVNCSDANETSWSTNGRAVLAIKQNSTATGQTQNWTWDMYLPNQGLPQNRVPAWVLWQWHAVGDSSGHNIGVNSDGTYRVTRQSAPGQVYERSFSGGPRITFDKWTPFRIQVKWSLGGDGFLRVWIDGDQVTNFSGATKFAGEGDPYLQFGWYADKAGVTNTVRFANIQRTVT